jgi:hypothetical protein
MMMLRYYFYDYASRFKEWLDAHRSAARISASLHAHGFTETSPGRWEKRG